VGLPEGMELGNTKSLGLQLVKSLTDQLDGSLQIVKTNGTCFRISFREPEFN
jgi:two-component sensor histidine kinase